MTYKFKRVLIIYLTLILLLNTTFLFFNSVKVRTGIFDLNPKISTFQLCNAALPLQGKHIGWVTTHNEDPYYQPPYFTQTLNDAKGMGASLDNITTEINSTLLNSYHIIIFEEGGNNWTANELIDLENWVRAGGSLYILGDDCDFAQVNVSAKFDVYYNNSDTERFNTILNKKYPILRGVNSIFAFFPSASINLTFSRNDLMIIARSIDNSPIIVALQEDKGRILWVVDADGIIDNTYIASQDNHQFANNSWLWLGGILGNEYSENPSNWWLILFFDHPEKMIVSNNMLIYLFIIGILIIVASIIVVLYWKKIRK